MGRLGDAITAQPDSIRLCLVGKLLETLDTDDRADLTRFLVSEVSSSKIERGLIAVGITHIKSGVLNKHRRRVKGAGCSCPV